MSDGPPQISILPLSLCMNQPLFLSPCGRSPVFSQLDDPGGTSSLGSRHRLTRRISPDLRCRFRGYRAMPPHPQNILPALIRLTESRD